MPLRFNVPPITRALLLVLTLLTFLNLLLRFRSAAPILSKNPTGVPYVTIVPAESYKFPWVLASAAFVEQNILSLSASSLTIFFGGRYLERAWGGSEYVKFVACVTVLPNFFTFLSYCVWRAVGGDASRATTTIHGGIALEAAFLVAFKQLVPEHTVSLFKSFIRIRVKHLPAVFVLANMISGPLLGTDTALFLSFYGFLTSWIYLRFYRISPAMVSSSTDGGPVIKGDASDTFAFSHFFPEPVQSAIAPVSNQIYNGMVAMRLCSPFSSEAIEAGNEQASVRAEGGLPSLMNPRGAGRSGGRREEAERRRALALKALDQRLNAAAASHATPANQEGQANITAPAESVAVPILKDSGGGAGRGHE